MTENKGITIAAVYIRVSSDDQMELSPDSQMAELQKYAHNNNIIIANEYVFIETEGISGKKSKNRPEFQRMIATAKTKPKPFDSILVWKFSRFARNQDESTFYKSMLRKKLGIDVVSISEPIMDGMYGRLMEMIIEWQDEFYSYNLSMEVTRSMKLKAQRGEYNGASSFPLGYVADENKKPVLDQKEAHIVRQIFDEYVNGTGRNVIVRHLNSQGYKTKRGGRFTDEAVEYILGNPFYIGKLRWNRREGSYTRRLKPEEDWIVSDADHEKLISDDVFNAVQDRTAAIKEIHKKYQHTNDSVRHWLSGIIVCPICGKTLSYKKTPRGKGSLQCNGYRHGLHNESQAISVIKMTSYIIDSLNSVLLADNFEYDVIDTHADSIDNTLRFYQNELKKLDTREERAKTAYMDGIDTIEEYKENKKAIEKMRTEMKCRIENLGGSEKENTDTSSKMKSGIRNVIDIIENSDSTNAEKDTALRSITKKIVYFKENQTLLFEYYIRI